MLRLFAHCEGFRNERVIIVTIDNFFVGKIICLKGDILVLELENSQGIEVYIDIEKIVAYEFIVRTSPRDTRYAERLQRKIHVNCRECDDTIQKIIKILKNNNSPEQVIDMSIAVGTNLIAPLKNILFTLCGETIFYEVECTETECIEIFAGVINEYVDSVTLLNLNYPVAKSEDPNQVGKMIKR